MFLKKHTLSCVQECVIITEEVKTLYIVWLWKRTTKCGIHIEWYSSKGNINSNTELQNSTIFKSTLFRYIPKYIKFFQEKTS
jgi:hypothetical protein